MDKDERICIVGAGVSGLSTAYYLEQMGYTNVTVLEKQNRVGGKCHTINYKGKTYELGAMLGVYSNRNVLELMKEFGVEGLGPILYRGFFDPDGNQIAQIDVEEAKEFQNQFFRLPEILKDYNDIWEPGYRNIPDSFTVPFKQWCEENEIPLVMKVYSPPFNAFGYGYFEDTPAIYVLKLLNFKLLNYFIEIDHLITLVDGLEALWEKMGSSLNDLRLSTNILEIKRGEKVYVKTDLEELEFDKLIVSCPLEKSLEFLDASEEERELFSKIQYNDFYVFAYKLENIPRVCGYIPANFKKDKVGHLLVWYYRWQDMAENDLVTVYALGNKNLSPKDVKMRVEDDLKRLGVKVEGLYTYTKWEHFPHVSGEDIRNGYYDRLEGLQGGRNTYYVGEIMNHSIIEECICYCKYFVEKFF